MDRHSKKPSPASPAAPPCPSPCPSVCPSPPSVSPAPHSNKRCCGGGPPVAGRAAEGGCGCAAPASRPAAPSAIPVRGEPPAPALNGPTAPGNAPGSRAWIIRPGGKPGGKPKAKPGGPRCAGGCGSADGGSVDSGAVAGKADGRERIAGSIPGSRLPDSVFCCPPMLSIERKACDASESWAERIAEARKPFVTVRALSRLFLETTKDTHER
eukprot:scaffold6915_cov96-Isochrysis_galbana.AAC.2